MNEIYRKPVPDISNDTRPYWDGLKAGRLMLQRCADCGKVRHYPRPMCDGCYSMNADWVQSTGKGTVHSYTISHHPFHAGFKEEMPYVLITVDLEEGVRLNAQARGIGEDAVRVGMPVRIGFEVATGEFSLPVVLPAA
jgi:uncharacterized protein